MKSPIALDQALVKELGVLESAELATDLKLAFVHAQIDEFKKLIWRNRIDTILSEKLMESDNEALAEKGRQNKTEYRNTVRQLNGAVEVLQQLAKELEA